MPRKDPRNHGLTGNDLLKYKYNYLIQRGIEPKYARKLRKNSWDKVENAIDLSRAGMQHQISLNPKQAAIKTKGARGKAAPDGYHWRAGFYNKKGTFIEPALVKNPTRQAAAPPAIYPKLMIFWKDQAQEIEGKKVITEVNKSLRNNINYLKTDINGSGNTPGYLEQNFGEIGKAETQIAYSQVDEQHFLNEYAGWTVIYNDIPKYKALLAVIATLGRYIYEPWRKQQAAGEIALAAEEINPTVGQKLLRDLNL